MHIKSRYILPINKDKIFTLIDLDTEKEYDCIVNGSIFIYFNLPVVKNEIKYVYELKAGRQNLASICGRVLYLKGKEPKIKSHVKNFSEKTKIKYHQNKIRRKVYNRLLGRINAAIKAKNGEKLNHTEELLGCKINFFIGYIEAKFTKGMTWDNHGIFGWHFDHVKECAKFDLRNVEQQKECFHYSNIRPLWATTEIAAEHGETNYIGNLNRNRFFAPLAEAVS